MTSSFTPHHPSFHPASHPDRGLPSRLSPLSLVRLARCSLPGVPFSIPKDPNLARSSKLKLNTILPEKPCLWTQETIACPLSYLVFGLPETLHIEFIIMALSSITSELSKGEVSICILFLGTAQELEKYLLNE